MSSLPQLIVIGPLTIHIYGLLIGLASLIGLLLVEKQLNHLNLNQNYFWRLTTFIMIFAVIGARLWHVATTWSFYQGQWWQVLNLNTGGMSILGALVGGLLGLVGLNAWYKKIHTPIKINNLTFLNLSVFGLPLAQAIGRLGNYVNQELYGLPTHSKFALYIDPLHRLPGFSSQAYYQPLFLYEIISLLVIAKLIYWLKVHKRTFFCIGSGHLFLIYLSSYSFARFILDFIRLDKARLPTPFAWLGLNQLIVFIVGLISLFSLLRARQQNA